MAYRIARVYLQRREKHLNSQYGCRLTVAVFTFSSVRKIIHNVKGKKKGGSQIEGVLK